VRTFGSIALLTVVLALTAGLTACGGSSATPEEKLCSALDDFQASVAAMQDLNVGSSSLEDVQDAIGNVVDAAGDVAAAAKDVASADVSELQASAESLSTALEDFPSPGSIQAITDGISTIGQAGAQAIDDLDCDTSS
jgi:hypothetical protein